MKKNILLITIILVFLNSCTDEPELNTYTVSILNRSNENITLKAYKETELLEELILPTNESGLKCKYSKETFLGYSLTDCAIDSLVFEFDNGKGYISSINYVSNFNFSDNENIFGNSSKIYKK